MDKGYKGRESYQLGCGCCAKKEPRFMVNRPLNHGYFWLSMVNHGQLWIMIIISWLIAVRLWIHYDSQLMRFLPHDKMQVFLLEFAGPSWTLPWDQFQCRIWVNLSNARGLRRGFEVVAAAQRTSWPACRSSAWRHVESRRFRCRFKRLHFARTRVPPCLTNMFGVVGVWLYTPFG